MNVSYRPAKMDCVAFVRCSIGFGTSPRHVQDVYTTLSERYDDSLLQEVAIEGMLQVVDQEWTNGIKDSYISRV